MLINYFYYYSQNQKKINNNTYRFAVQLRLMDVGRNVSSSSSASVGS